MSATQTFQKLAARMMAKYGVKAVLTRVALAHNEDTNEVTETPSSQSILMVLDEIKHDDPNSRLTVGTYIRSNTKLKPEDRIAVNGKSYIVESVEELAPQATGILYTAKVRG